MIFFGILIAAFAVGFILAIQYCTKAIAPVACALGLFISLFCLVITNYNNCQKAKVEALSSANIKPLSEEQVYNMSKAELDKCYTITTLNGSYYYIIQEK